MSRPTYAPKETYTGNGTTDTFTFDFKIESLSHLLVVVYDDEGVEVKRVRGTDTVFLDTVTFDDTEGGGTVVLQSNLTSDYEIILLQANDAPTQDYSFRNKSSFKLPRFEWALDLLAGAIQRLSFLSSQSLKIAERDEIGTNLPSVEGNGGKCIIVKDDESGYELAPRVDTAELSEAIGEISFPTGGITNSVLSKSSAADADTQWETMDFSGYSNFIGASVSYSGLTEIINAILDFQYIAPAVSLTVTGSTTIREKGDSVTSATFTANITKRSNDIETVEYFVGGVSYATEASPNPSGGTETQAWTGSIDDTTVFSVEVTDTTEDSGGPSTVSSSRTFTFVYPYYYGIGAAGLTPAQVAALTKDVRTENTNLNRNFGATSAQVYYFAYPASYGTLSSILDENGFETISDWTLTVSNITGLDSTAVSYNIYEFDNVVTALATNYTFAQ